MLNSQGSTAARMSLLLLGLAVAFLLPIIPASAQGGGRKFALVIGINRYPYLSEKKQLQWAVTDAGNARRMLVEEFNFPRSNVEGLFDADATRAEILRSLRRALSQVGARDVFVLYYSGHGTLFPDSKSEVLDETQLIDEVVDGETQRLKRLLNPDKFDSAICPSDVAGPNTSGKGWGNLILDDELFDIFTAFTNKGCEVVLLADSCNSGSLGKGMSGEGSGGDRPKLIESHLALGRDWHEIPTPRVQRTLVRTSGDLNGRFIAFTAAKDQELAWESARGGGYFTQALVAAASGNNNVATFECLFRALKRNVKKVKSIQEPQMDTRFFHRAPTNTLFLNYAEPSHLKVLVKITDTQGRHIPDAKFAVLRKGVLPKAHIDDDALLLGQTDFGGLYDSGCPQVERGTYWVVAEKKGYKVFEERVTIEANAPGVAVLRIRLAQM